MQKMTIVFTFLAIFFTINQAHALRKNQDYGLYLVIKKQGIEVFRTTVAEGHGVGRAPSKKKARRRARDRIFGCFNKWVSEDFGDRTNDNDWSLKDNCTGVYADEKSHSAKNAWMKGLLLHSEADTGIKYHVCENVSKQDFIPATASLEIVILNNTAYKTSALVKAVTCGW